MVARKYGRNIRILVKSNRPSKKIHDSLNVLLNDMSLLQNLGDKLSRNRSKVFYEIVTFFMLDMCSKPIFFSNVA